MQYIWIFVGNLALSGLIGILTGSCEILKGARQYHKQGSNKSEILRTTSRRLTVILNTTVFTSGLVMMCLFIVILLQELTGAYMKLLYIGMPLVTWTLSIIGICVCNYIHKEPGHISRLEGYFWVASLASVLLMGFGVVYCCSH